MNLPYIYCAFFQFFTKRSFLERKKKPQEVSLTTEILLQNAKNYSKSFRLSASGYALYISLFPKFSFRPRSSSIVVTHHTRSLRWVPLVIFMFYRKCRRKWIKRDLLRHSRRSRLIWIRQQRQRQPERHPRPITHPIEGHLWHQLRLRQTYRRRQM